MGTAGIVAEYNPFHLGHAYQISETRGALGGDAGVVCVMSGNFVQRGECAVLDKWSRTRCALAGGADLVLELPTPWAISSAEGFARGAVEILAATGVVDTLSFGYEGGRLEDLQGVADCLRTAEYAALLRGELDKGVSFAAAREKAAKALVGKAAECLATPNNNLAVEYLKAIGTLGAKMAAIAIPRRGGAHDGAEAADGFASASAIRTMLAGGALAEAGRYLPAATGLEWEKAAAEGRAPATLLNCERGILARLRTMTEADFAALPDGGGGEGLSYRLGTAVSKTVSYETVLDETKTKRYAHSRIRRLALCAFLGLTAEDRPARVPYVRVLGMNGRGKELLGQMKKTCALPIITKPAHAKRLQGPARRLFDLEARCTDLYALCTPKIQPCGLEWVTGPVVLDEKTDCKK